MRFSTEIQRFVDSAQRDIDKTVRGIELKIAESLIDMSPVGNPDLWEGSPPPGYVGGRFRGNWQFSIGKAASGTLSTIDANGGATKSKLADAISKAVSGDVHFITNNLPYSLELEYGHSSQAPNGMVRLTVARFQSIVRQIARK